MRSRDVRPFAVEIKSKKRTPSAPPPSLWGETAHLFKTVADPSEPPTPHAPAGPAKTMRPSETERAQTVPERRVLPDLRAVRADGEAPIEPAGADRENRRGRRAVPSQGREHRGGKGVRPIAPVREPQPAADPQVTLFAPEPAAAAIASLPAAITASVAARQGGAAASEPRKTARKWARQIGDLPRSERWRRRLPEVCR